MENQRGRGRLVKLLVFALALSVAGVHANAAGAEDSVPVDPGGNIICSKTTREIPGGNVSCASVSSASSVLTRSRS